MKAARISSLALANNWLSVVSRYHTEPVPVVSTSAQYGAISWRFPERGKACGVKVLTALVKDMSPLLLTCKEGILYSYKLITHMDNES